VSAVEAFLAQQKRFRCERLSADLTEAQCKANQVRTPEIFACIGCAGLGKAIQLEECMGYGKECKCVSCEQVKPIMERGMCPSCYNRKRAAGSLESIPKKSERTPPVKVKAAPVPVETVAVAPVPSDIPVYEPIKRNPLLPLVSDRVMELDFAERADLYDWLQANKVTGEQIMELLSLSYQGVLRRSA
jgi:hypothetical protein